jgi:tRNA wybutosine-synthesizing protein 4
MQLWTHYDVMDNILINVVGRKRVVLFPVSQHNNLYVSGSSSPVLNIDFPNLSKYPRYLEAHQASVEVILGPGDALLIPALWFHHITALDACISVNLFYKRASLCSSYTVNTAAVPSSSSAISTITTTTRDLYDPKDLYGNKDLPCLVAIKDKLLQEVKKQLVDATHSSAVVPEEFRALSIRQLVAELEVAATELEMKAAVTKKGH